MTFRVIGSRHCVALGKGLTVQSLQYSLKLGQLMTEVQIDSILQNIRGICGIETYEVKAFVSKMLGFQQLHLTQNIPFKYMLYYVKTREVP
jgi:hypothetical protein